VELFGVFRMVRRMARNQKEAHELQPGTKNPTSPQPRERGAYTLHPRWGNVQGGGESGGYQPKGEPGKFRSKHVGKKNKRQRFLLELAGKKVGGFGRRGRRPILKRCFGKTERWSETLRE